MALTDIPGVDEAPDSQRGGRGNIDAVRHRTMRSDEKNSSPPVQWAV